MRTEKIFAIWMTLAILLSTTFVVCQLTEQVHASGNNDFIQVEQKIWDVQTQEWVDESDVVVGSIVKFKCTITNIGSYYFSSVKITVTFPGVIDYYGSGVAPYYVSPDNKIIMINCPDQAACLYPGETWSFESLAGVVMAIGDGDNKMEITAIKDDGSEFYDFDTVTLHSTIIGKIVQVEQKIWDAETEEWVDEADVSVGSMVTFKCTITNLGPYDFSSIILGVTFPSIVDYYGSGVAPSYVSSDKKTIAINVPSQAACLYSGGTWSFESLVGIVVASGDGDNKMEISPFTAEGYQFYDFDNVNLHSSDASEPSAAGWIYGTMLASTPDEGTFPLEGILIEVNTLTGEFVNSSYTDSNGYYEIHDLEFGTYEVTFTYKNGDKPKLRVIVKDAKGNKCELLSEELPNLSLINEAIEEGNVGSKISIWEEQPNIFQHNISIYNGVEIKNLDIKKGSISFIVSGNETSAGKTIVIDVDSSVFDLSSQILVNYDGEPIDMADDINDILDPNDDGTHPEYLISIGAEGVQLLISIPHFSEHFITFFNLTPEQAAQFLTYAVIAAVGLIIIAAVVMFRKGKED